MVDLVLGLNFGLSLSFCTQQFAPKLGVCPMMGLMLGLDLGVSLRVGLEEGLAPGLTPGLGGIKYDKKTGDNRGALPVLG